MALGVGALSHTVIDEVTMIIKVRCQSRGETVIYWGLWILVIVVLISFWIDLRMK
jgi:FtsH-binding integral membrane protein